VQNKQIHSYDLDAAARYERIIAGFETIVVSA
jgi:hypothetical protein